MDEVWLNRGVLLKRKEEKHSPVRRHRKLWDAVGMSALTAFAAIFIAVMGITLHQRFTATGPYRMDYAGRVVDKSATIGESQTGSYPVRRLHIRERGGGEFDVIVNENLYGRAQVGMWVKSSKCGGRSVMGGTAVMKAARWRVDAPNNGTHPTGIRLPLIVNLAVAAASSGG